MRRRKPRGQSLIETMTGFIILIPIGLVSFNLVTLFTSAQINEQLAETAARGAATQTNLADARKSAEDAVSRCQLTSVIERVGVEDVFFDQVKQQVIVITTMDVKMPVPLPYFSKVTTRADSMQPIVSTPAQK